MWLGIPVWIGFKSRSSRFLPPCFHVWSLKKGHRKTVYQYYAHGQRLDPFKAHTADSKVYKFKGNRIIKKMKAMGAPQCHRLSREALLEVWPCLKSCQALCGYRSLSSHENIRRVHCWGISQKVMRHCSLGLFCNFEVVAILTWTSQLSWREKIDCHLVSQPV